MTSDEIYTLDHIRDRLVMLAVNVKDPQRQDRLLRLVYEIGRILEEAEAEIDPIKPPQGLNGLNNNAP